MLKTIADRPSTVHCKFPPQIEWVVLVKVRPRLHYTRLQSLSIALGHSKHASRLFISLYPPPILKVGIFFLQARIAATMQKHWMGEWGKRWGEVAEIVQLNIFLMVSQGLLARIVHSFRVVLKTPADRSLTVHSLRRYRPTKTHALSVCHTPQHFFTRSHASDLLFCLSFFFCFWTFNKINCSNNMNIASINPKFVFCD